VINFILQSFLQIKLVEALCGTSFVVNHLDDRKLLVKTAPGVLIRPGDVKTIDDEGMPMHRNPFVKVIILRLIIFSE
jgi:DnaJ-class molecular chaperone